MPDNALIGIAGVHHVVSELSRRGLVALPTVKNTAAYDIVALNVEGNWHANIQVKTSSKRVGFFPMPPAEKVRSGSCDFYVLVRWGESDQRYEGFLLSGREAKRAVADSVASQAKSIELGKRKKSFPCIVVGAGNAINENATRWAKAWARWRR